MGLVITPMYPKVTTIAPVSIPDAEITTLATDRWDIEYGEFDLAPREVQAAACVAQARGMAPELVEAILAFAAAVEFTGYGIMLWRNPSSAPWTLCMTGAPHEAPEVACSASTAYAVLTELGISYDPEQAYGRVDAQTVLTRCQAVRGQTTHTLCIEQLQRVAEYALSRGISEIAWA